MIGNDLRFIIVRNPRSPASFKKGLLAVQPAWLENVANEINARVFRCEPCRSYG